MQNESILDLIMREKQTSSDDLNKIYRALMKGTAVKLVKTIN